MNEMQDNELDDLFRKSLTDPDIPFDPDAWKAMESKLDSEDRRGTAYFRIYAGIIAGVFLLAGTLFFINQNNMQSLAQHDSSAIVPAAHLPHVSSDNKSADHPGFSTRTGTANNTDKDNTNNHANRNGAAQKADQETDASVTQKRHAAASDYTKDIQTKNTVAGRTDAAYNRKYHSAQKYTSPAYNNNGTYIGIDKPGYGYKDAAMDTASAQQTGTSGQEYIAATNNSIENNGTAEKNRLTEERIATGMNSSAIGTKKSALSSGSRNTNTDIPVTTTTTTTNNNNNNNNTGTGADNIQPSALRDTTQQQMHSNLNASNLNASNVQHTIAAEYAIPKASDTLVLGTADPIPVKADSLTDADTSSVKEKIKKDSYKRGFSMSLILSPEYNSPVDFSFYKPGLNIGFNIEYYILPRISLVSGIMYGQKLYACDANDYASSPSYARYGKNYYPEYVKATCGVLDVPVNIRYKFLNRKTVNVYASTGLSSYIMLKETYIFQYANKSTHPDDQQQVYNKNRYLFNIWNISFGVEKRITDNWSVQAEPYVKAPLNGIGAGDIKLVSTGIYFSLKYYFK